MAANGRKYSCLAHAVGRSRMLEAILGLSFNAPKRLRGRSLVVKEAQQQIISLHSYNAQR